MGELENEFEAGMMNDPVVPAYEIEEPPDPPEEPEEIPDPPDA